MLALLGSLTGFLFFNFNPARIFLGDSGTLFVGFVLASASVMCTVKSATLVGLALPALALGLPIFDTLMSIVRRVLERRSIFSPDRNHIHHRLLMMGLHQRSAVIVMYAVTLLAACLGLFMMVSRDTGALIIFVVASLLILALFRIAGAIRLRESLGILKRNLGTARQTRAERRQFEDVELRMRETESFEEWWAALCDAAENMDFVWMSLSLKHRDRAVVTSVWRRPGPPALAGRAVRIAMPVGSYRSGHSVWVDAAVMVNGSLEAAGRRTTLFERLIDEHRMKVVLGVLKSTGGVKSEKRLGA
jgi:UDP-GlcNAc:undecaprenyl-phosphate GlcNAc-1-phosphate transferase